MWTKNIDKNLIILQVLTEFYQKNNITEIRRTELKEHCDNRLYELTNGEQVEYGGSFERCLKSLEEVGALKCIKKGKKLTVIVSDLKRIDSLLLNKKLNDSFMNVRVILPPKNIEDEMWEEIIESEANSAFDGKAEEIVQNFDTLFPIKDKTKQLQSHLFLKQAATRIASHISSRLLEFYIQHKDDNFQASSDIVKDLGMIARKIAKNNPQAQFKVIIEYKGISESGIKLGQIMGPAISKIMGENFRNWATSVLHHNFNEEDKRHLNDGRFDLLSPIAKGFYEEIYYPSLQYYANLFNK
jgi:hypothetical protein